MMILGWFGGYLMKYRSEVAIFFAGENGCGFVSLLLEQGVTDLVDRDRFLLLLQNIHDEGRNCDLVDCFLFKHRARSLKPDVIGR